MSDGPAAARRMVQELAHRGPDANGIAALPDGRGFFVHTRLKIIDLSERAAQPFSSEDGRIVLSFNGEIYNFQELRRALERDGASFRSTSDTEVILQQYRLRGLAGLDELDGMFAFAIWDAVVQRLVLMRDRLGKKPLYYAAAPDAAFVFGSEIKALTAYEALPIEPDPEQIPPYLFYGYVPTPSSLYRGVKKLPPASRLILEPGSAPRVERYWSLDEAAGRPLEVGVKEATQLVRDAVGRAVERRLIADVPIGAFLSGGIDSSIVVAEMARRSRGRVKTYTVGFEDDATYDERAHARDIARRFSTEHTELVVKSSPVGLLEKLLHHHDEPYVDSSALAVYAVAEATKRHVSVVLTGDGGDEVFAGYTRFRGGMIADHIPVPATRLVHEVLERLPEPRGYKNPVSLLRRFVEHGGRSTDEQLLAWNSTFAGDRLRGILRPELYRAFDPWSVARSQVALLEQARSRGSDRLDQILRHNLATYLLDDLLVKADRMTMAVALEARSPFLDTQLVELAFRLPSELKMRHGRLKWLLREAYRGILPASVLDRKKHGFGVPIGKWWSGELAPMVDDLLLSRSSRSGEYLDRAAINALVLEHRSGRRDHGHRIFALLQLELWLRRVGRRPATSEAA